MRVDLRCPDIYRPRGPSGLALSPSEPVRRPGRADAGQAPASLGDQSRLRADSRALLAANPVPGDEIPRVWPPKPARGESSSLLGGQSRLRANSRALLAANPVPGDEIPRVWPPKPARGESSSPLGGQSRLRANSRALLAANPVPGDEIARVWPPKPARGESSSPLGRVKSQICNPRTLPSPDGLHRDQRGSCPDIGAVNHESRGSGPHAPPWKTTGRDRMEVKGTRSASPSPRERDPRGRTPDRRT